MNNIYKSIALSVFFVAFFASTAQAETTEINPGNIGSEAQDFNFDASTVTVDIVWTDNKTLEWGAGTHIFFLLGPAGSAYGGILLDAAGIPIPGTELIGTTPTTADPGKAGLINLAETTVFSGIRLSSPAFFDQGFSTAWAWNWTSSDRPLVGAGLPAPVADAGGPYSTTIQTEATFNGRNSQPPEGGSIVSYDWDFGDGGTATGVAPTYVYAADGTYTITLTVTADNGATDIDETEATVALTNLAPVADPGGPYAGSLNNPVAVDASGSTDDSGGIARYDWAWGDGSSAADTGVTTTHSYAEEKIFNANLTVTDGDSLQDTAGTQVTISAVNQFPTANAGGPYSGIIDVAVAFDGTASVDPEGQELTYDWIWGDGTSAPNAGPTPKHTYAASCICQVSLTVDDGFGGVNKNNTVAIITVSGGNEQPVADANGPYQSTVDVPVTFDATASTDPDGDALLYDWDYGDDSEVDVDAGPTPSHTYTAAGVFAATVVVYDGNIVNGDDAAAAFIYIAAGNVAPTADAGGPYNGTTDVAVNFDGTSSADSDGEIVRYDWDYGDGSALDEDAGPTPSHTYTVAAEYTATLTVTDDDGATDSSDKVVAIDQANMPPVADAGLPYTGTVDVAVSFDGSGSTDSDGTIASYAWDFGDGATATGVAPTHTYTSSDLFTVTLTVTDDGATIDTDSTTATIAVGNLPPVSDVGGPYSGMTDVAVNFDGSGSTDDGSIALYEWDFDGDGVIDDSSGPTPSFTYSAEGVYAVSLRVTDDRGVPNTSSTEALIDLPPQAPVSNAGGPYTGAVDVAVNFDGSASTDPDGNIDSYSWDFGDGATATGVAPTHTYATSEIFTVTLTVTDNDGTTGPTDTATTTASIGAGNQAPVADAGGPYPGLINVALTFDGSGSVDPDGDPLVYEWDFGDDSPVANGVKPTHTYTTAGVRNVILTVKDDEDTPASDSATTLIGSGTSEPVADAGGPYSAGTLTFNFDGTGSSDPDGGKLRYAWDFGDGAVASGVSPSHTYAATGSYDVTLVVIDDTGRASEDLTDADVLVDVPNVVGQEQSVAEAAIVAANLFVGDVTTEASATVPAGNVISQNPAACTTCVAVASAVDLVVSGGPVLISVPNVVGQEQSDAESAIMAAGLVVGTINTESSQTVAEGDVIRQNPVACTACVPAASTVNLVVSSGLPVVSVTVKTKSKGSAFGLVELLMLALFAGFLKTIRGRRIGSGPTSAAAAVLGMLLIVPLQGQAADLGWYGGIGAGASKADFNYGSFQPNMAALGHTVTGFSVDYHDTGYKVFGGVSWGKYFAGELAYVDLGEVTATFDVTTDDPQQMAKDANELLPILGDGIALSAIGRYPFGDRFAIFGKVGAYAWEADNSISVSGDVEGSSDPSVDGTDVLYGIGGELYFPNFVNGLFGARLEWERYALDQNDVDFISASVLFRFGGGAN